MGDIFTQHAKAVARHWVLLNDQYAIYMTAPYRDGLTRCEWDERDASRRQMNVDIVKFRDLSKGC